MHKNRIEAFSDGVIAIILTIMVLELKVPHGDSWVELQGLIPVFFSYILSFVYVGIYWNNHHHLFQAVREIKGGVLWANLHLLFWLSLTPFATAWAGENHFTSAPVALYGIILLMCAISYTILVRCLLASHSDQSVLKQAIGADIKGYISLCLYVVAVAVAWFYPAISCVLYITVAAIWFIPDRRIENRLPHNG